MFGALVFAVVGLMPPILVDQFHKGNLTYQAPCKVEHVKAENGPYVYSKIIDDGKCS